MVDSLMTSGGRIGQSVTSPVPQQPTHGEQQAAIAAAKATALTELGQFVVTPCL